MNDDEVKLIQIFVTIIVAFITAFLTNINERKKQTTVFFKQEGIETQKSILDFWCSILFYDYKTTINKYKRDNYKRIMKENSLTKADEIQDSMIIKLVQKDSYMYSSRLTIKYIGVYMQEIYKTLNNTMKQLFLVSKIISSMKYDFTGEKTSALNLLRIKINDLDVKKILKISLYQIKYFFVIRFL